MKLSFELIVAHAPLTDHSYYVIIRRIAVLNELRCVRSDGVEQIKFLFCLLETEFAASKEGNQELIVST